MGSRSKSLLLVGALAAMACRAPAPLPPDVTVRDLMTLPPGDAIGRHYHERRYVREGDAALCDGRVALPDALLMGHRDGEWWADLTTGRPAADLLDGSVFADGRLQFSAFASYPGGPGTQTGEVLILATGQFTPGALQLDVAVCVREVTLAPCTCSEVGPVRYVEACP